jgi:hypothetical protein
MKMAKIVRETVRAADELRAYAISRWEPKKAAAAVAVLYAYILAGLEPEDEHRMVAETLKMAQDFRRMLRERIANEVGM